MEITFGGKMTVKVEMEDSFRTRKVRMEKAYVGAVHKQLIMMILHLSG